MNTKSLEEKLEKISEKLDKVNDRLNSVDVTLVKQEENLKEHMRRTLLNETAIEKITDNLIPINKHVSHVEGALKLLGGLATFAGVVTGIVKLFF
jgi:chromosome segregation ATPase